LQIVALTTNLLNVDTARARALKNVWLAFEIVYFLHESTLYVRVAGIAIGLHRLQLLLQYCDIFVKLSILLAQSFYFHRICAAAAAACKSLLELIFKAHWCLFKKDFWKRYTNWCPVFGQILDLAPPVL
jgi:hypothetical protein